MTYPQSQFPKNKLIPIKKWFVLLFYFVSFQRLFYIFYDLILFHLEFST